MSEEFEGKICTDKNFLDFLGESDDKRDDKLKKFSVEVDRMLKVDKLKSEKEDLEGKEEERTKEIEEAVEDEKKNKMVEGRFGKGASNRTYGVVEEGQKAGNKYVIQVVDNDKDNNYEEYNAKVKNLDFMALCCSGECPHQSIIAPPTGRTAAPTPAKGNDSVHDEHDEQSNFESMEDLSKKGMGVAKMYAVWKVGNNTYSISEKCNGGDLSDLFKLKGRTPSTGEAVVSYDIYYPIKKDTWSAGLSPLFRLMFCHKIYEKILKTLRCLHKNKIFHLDIKPENVMLMNKIENNDITTWNGEDWDTYTNIRLIDFGFSCKDDDCNDVVSVRGTPGYISPLMFKKTPEVTGLCDVWSSTILFYAMYLGDPFYFCHLFHNENKKCPSDIFVKKEFLENPLEFLDNDNGDQQIPDKFNTERKKALFLKMSKEFRESDRAEYLLKETIEYLKKHSDNIYVKKNNNQFMGHPWNISELVEKILKMSVDSDSNNNVDTILDTTGDFFIFIIFGSHLSSPFSFVSWSDIPQDVLSHVIIKMNEMNKMDDGAHTPLTQEESQEEITKEFKNPYPDHIFDAVKSLLKSSKPTRLKKYREEGHYDKDAPEHRNKLRMLEEQARLPLKFRSIIGKTMKNFAEDKANTYDDYVYNQLGYSIQYKVLHTSGGSRSKFIETILEKEARREAEEKARREEEDARVNAEEKKARTKSNWKTVRTVRTIRKLFGGRKRVKNSRKRKTNNRKSKTRKKN